MDIEYADDTAPATYTAMIDEITSRINENPNAVVSVLHMAPLISAMTCCGCGYRQTISCVIRFNFFAMAGNRG